MKSEFDCGGCGRRDFIGALLGASAAAGMGASALAHGQADGGRILFGACRDRGDVKLLAGIGYDFWEWNVPSALNPDKDEKWWAAQKEEILSQPIPLRSCNGFIPGRFRLTGPKAEHGPALDYAEKALRRADEIGVKTVVFGSGGARNVPGDFTAAKRGKWPDVEKGVEQFTDFCRKLCGRVADLRTTTVVIEPLRANESNIVNFVWQGAQICKDVNSPRLAQLADIFHMLAGRESPDSIVKAGSLLKHCHVASLGTRNFPGAEPETVARLRPYFDALRAIGYTGGVSCECGWGKKGELAKNLETALKTLRSL